MKPPTEWDDQIAAAVASVEVDDNGNVIKVRLWDKNTALDKIAKHLGMFVQQSVSTVSHRYELMDEQQLRDEIAQIISEAKALRPGRAN